MMTANSAVEKLLLSAPLTKILVGDFGSGKTELALNFSLCLRDHGYEVTIVDLDLVKPYFRTRESQEMLEQRGVHVAAPIKRYAHADLPVLPEGLTRVFHAPQHPVIVDVGGSDGAIVLGQLQPQLTASGYQAWLVVNACRPFTSTVAGVRAMLQNIQRAAQIRITGLINNTNLGRDTTVNEVQRGRRVAAQVQQETGLPLLLSVVPHWLEPPAAGEEPLFSLQPQIMYPWMV